MRYAIISDIHANFAALDAVEREVERLRALDFDDRPIHFWFLGDLIGYGPQPVECLRWLRETSGIYSRQAKTGAPRWVPGNHDEWLVRNEKVHADAAATLQRHKELLLDPANSDLGDWFQAEVRAATNGATPYDEEPRSLVIERFDGLTAVFAHAGVKSRRGEYLYPWKTELLDDDCRQLAELVGGGTGVLFCGHTHFPMWLRWSPEGGARPQSIKYRQPTPLGEGLMVINPGSVGQPRDGDARAAYVLLDSAAGTVEFRRVEYPLEATTSLLRGDPAYPESLAERLEQTNVDINRQQYETLYRRPVWDLEAV